MRNVYIADKNLKNLTNLEYDRLSKLVDDTIYLKNKSIEYIESLMDAIIDLSYLKNCDDLFYKLYKYYFKIDESNSNEYLKMYSRVN